MKPMMLVEGSLRLENKLKHLTCGGIEPIISGSRKSSESANPDLIRLETECKSLDAECLPKLEGVEIYLFV